LLILCILNRRVPSQHRGYSRRIVVDCAPSGVNRLEPARQSRILKFGLFEVDLEAGELRKSGMRHKLASQPFQVLRILLEHPQQIVLREELQQRIWPQDTFVDYDLALKKAVNRIREVLGDSAESPRFIETIPRRGYRFIAPISGNGHEGTVELPVAENAQSRRSLRIGIALGLGVAALLGAVLEFMPSESRHRIFGEDTTPRIRSIAVLPLQNLSNDPAQEYFSDGLTDALITDLAQMGSVRVISRTSSMQYAQTKKSLPEIARELHVEGIIEGTVQRSGDRVRITAQLIYGPSDKHLWANSYERDMRDVFALERDVTEDIARQVQAKFTTQNHAAPSQPRPTNPTALEAYLQGKYYLTRFGRGSGDDAQREAAAYFQRAIEADPNFAPAYHGLANAHMDLLWPSNQDGEIAKRAAERAVELAPDSSEARSILGLILTSTWNFPAAEEQLRRALALSPNSADAHDNFSNWLLVMGRVDDALSEARVAQQLDPFGNHLPSALSWARDYDGAIAAARTLLQSDPDNGYFHFELFRAYALKGMDKDSIEEAETTFRLFGHPEAAANIHRAFAASGYGAGLRQVAQEFERLIATKQGSFLVNCADIHAFLGDKDRAFYWLEEAYRQHDTHWTALDIELEWINAEPMLDSLRSDPRYKDLVLRIGLPP
jgi:TolB-like protein/DNA-binding winged helix-turn-helix (wHTH) protein/Tfp pilus assembly protein PilF